MTINNSLPTWSATNSATISASGLFTMPPETLPDNYTSTVTATYNGQVQRAIVYHQPFSVPSGIQFNTGNGPSGTGFRGNFHFFELSPRPTWNIGFATSTDPYPPMGGLSDCYFQVSAPDGALVRLADDQGSLSTIRDTPRCGIDAPCSTASNPVLSNSQCSINIAQSGWWFLSNGTNFNEQLAISFLRPKMGTNLRIWATNNTSMQWSQVGSWGVPYSLPPVVHQDAPLANSTVGSMVNGSSVVNVSGWALDHADLVVSQAHYEGPIATVQLFIDGNLVQTQTATQFTQAPWVCATYAWIYPCPSQVGYSFLWDSTSVGDGTQRSKSSRPTLTRILALRLDRAIQ